MLGSAGVHVLGCVAAEDGEVCFVGGGGVLAWGCARGAGFVICYVFSMLTIFVFLSLLLYSI